MFYDGVFGSEGCVLAGVGGVKLMIWNSGIFFCYVLFIDQ
jgi:hypothetical protein